MTQFRQLAAIMFTDIVGYTALMGEDEHQAFEVLKKNRRIQRPLIEQCGGRWIKELGDGVLASFATGTDAVFCAASIQKACSGEPWLKLRIGIHLGDVVFENDDVFGDSVNIASRIQALAPVGGIWITETVHKSVANKKGLALQFVREVSLKNVREPVRVYEVQLEGFEGDPARHIPSEPAKTAKEPTRRAVPQKSIAVLPFVNMSNDPEQEYFSDGIAEEILTSLSHLRDLKVAGRTSSFQFKGKNVDLREVGEKLGVSTVLEGSVRKQANRLRITAQFINVADGFHIWSEKYDRNMDDIFAIQDEIALAITDKLKITFFDDEKEKLNKTSTRNKEAYELYLKGKFYIGRRGSFILPGMRYFEHAIALDPDFALAHTGYADALNIAAFYGFFSGKSVMKAIKQGAETAMQLDGSLSEAYFSLGSYYVLFERNCLEAKKHCRTGIELNANYAIGHSWYGTHMAWMEGKFEEAIRHGQIAIGLEPLSAIDHADLAWTHYTAGQFEEALAVARTGIDLDANSFLSHRLACLSCIALKRNAEAIDTFTYLMTISNRHQHSLTGLIWAYCSDGKVEEARPLMEELDRRTATEYIATTYYGIAAAYLGDLDKAFHLLYQSLADCEPNLTQLKYSPYIPDALRSDARFAEVLTKIGYSD